MATILLADVGAGDVFGAGGWAVALVLIVKEIATAWNNRTKEQAASDLAALNAKAGIETSREVATNEEHRKLLGLQMQRITALEARSDKLERKAARMEGHIDYLENVLRDNNIDFRPFNTEPDDTPFPRKT